MVQLHMWGSGASYGSRLPFFVLRSSAGIAQVDPHGPATAVEYFALNHIGTTRGVTNAVGDDADPVVYTAFGEKIDGTFQTYGFAGAYGYQSTDTYACDGTSADIAFPYQHVGWRYYDPITGRFLQTDPIHIAGGMNVYAYVENNPLVGVDPSGLQHYPVERMPGAPWMKPPYPGPPGSGHKLYPHGWLPKPGPNIPWYKESFRFTPPHIRACVVVAAVSYGAGTAANNIPRAFGAEKNRATDYFIDWVWGKIYGEENCPGC